MRSIQPALIVRRTEVRVCRIENARNVNDKDVYWKPPVRTHGSCITAATHAAMYGPMTRTTSTRRDVM
jgi:hypothetical protein